MLNYIHKFLSNDPSIFGAPLNDEPLRGRIRAEQIGSILRYTPYMLLANVINAIVLVMAFTGSAKQNIALVWALGLSAFVFYSYLRWRTTQKRAKRNYVSARGPRHATYNAALLGGIWCTLPILFLHPSPDSPQIIIMGVIIGMICGGAFALATIPGAALAFITPIIISSIYSCLAYNVPYGDHLSFLLILFSFVVVRASYSQACLFVERLLGENEQEKQREMISILLGEFEENANDWLWETNSRGELTYASGSFSELTGRPLETLLGKSLLRMLTRGFDGPPQPETAWLKLNEHLNSHTPFRGLEIKVVTNGVSRWFSLTGKPIAASTGQFDGFRGFCSDITDKREDEAKIAYLARFDSITSLPNRVSFGEKLDSCLHNQQRKGGTFALHCIDLDGFKEINDTFGHAIGDAFLQEVGRRITSCLGADDFVARLGGDEFSIIQINLNDSFDAADFARAIIDKISEPFSIAGNTMRAGASVGIAMVPKDGTIRDRLMVNGDLALYQAKSDGRGTHVFFDPSMDDQARERRQIESELRNAIENGELCLHFQPIMDVETQTVKNCESLLRWKNPKLGEVSPATFIPIAEECGLIIGIGEWVISEACKQAANWPEDTKVAVNLSAVQFQSPGLLPTIMRALDESGIEADRLEVEITESVLISNIERVKSIIDTLGTLGVRIALDDFGTGYSSLAYIRQIKFDKIKIDASFVREMLTDESCAAIIRAVTGLAHELGMKITAEGVETQEQLETLVEHGCAGLQGFLISEPLPAEEFSQYVGLPADIDKQVA